MLAIRLQRTGRAGHAQFRLIVQDSRFSPTSGRVVAQVGHFDPHSKKLMFDGEQISKFLDNGAQPSDRAAKLLKKEGVKLPAWVKLDPPKKRAIRNPDRLRRNRPVGAPAPEKPAEEPVAEEAPTAETPVEEAAAEPAEAETPAEPAETPTEEAPAEPPVEPAAEAAPEEAAPAEPDKAA